MQELEQVSDSSEADAGYLHYILITLNLYRTRYILYDCVIFPYRGEKLLKVCHWLLLSDENSWA